MELRVLRYFYTVAREESITRAARLLHITQPTLSRQLMQLEEELGAALFRRGGHRVVVPEDGLLLQQPSQELLELADKVRGMLAAFDPGDPAVAAIKQSPVYQKVAYLIEGLEAPVFGGLKQ